ncbi:MAG TPA: hypothetical protein VIL72_12345 [Beijerinckiaceae bacterium]|jgi:hypothetical protein
MKKVCTLDSGLAPALVPLAAALLVYALFSAPAQAQKADGVYLIPVGGGYGVDECVAQSYECGKIVATAWCESHGHGVVKGFGRAGDVTNSTGAGAKPVPADAVVISCGE